MSIFSTYLQEYLNDPPDPLKHRIFYIEINEINVLVSHGKMLSFPYFQGGICFLDENNPSYF